MPHTQNTPSPCSLSVETMERANKAELIKWWDALESICWSDFEEALAMARECRHPDAQWLASLFPVCIAVRRTRKRVLEVLAAQGEDGRALFLAWIFGADTLNRAAQLSYPPAQTHYGRRKSTNDPFCAFAWWQEAASQGDRAAMKLLGDCYYNGRGCKPKRRHIPMAIALYKEAAELGYIHAQKSYGTVAFGAHDWERYYWWAKALQRLEARGFKNYDFVEGLCELLLSFENGECGRIVFAVAPTLRVCLGDNEESMFEVTYRPTQIEKLRRVIKWYEVILDRARRAMDCWSVVGRRLHLARDVRAVIAKIAWEEAWQWGEKRE